VLHRGISGDLLELATDHLRSRAVRLLALPAPNTDYARYNESYQGDDADQQGQCHDFAAGRYYHRHLSHGLAFVAITRVRMSRYRNLHSTNNAVHPTRDGSKTCVYVSMYIYLYVYE